MLKRWICLLLLACLWTASAALGEESPTVPELTARPGSFPKNQRYDVYEGPRQEHRRAGGGKAVVSTNGEILVYGTWLGRMMIEYALDDNRHRIGWIDTDQLPASALEGVPALPFPDGGYPEDFSYGIITTRSTLIDDPRHSRGYSATINAGTSVHVLARLDGWHLVEGFIDEELRMGFSHQNNLDLEHGYAANPEYAIDKYGRYAPADIWKAIAAVTRFIHDQRPGTNLVAIRYVEADSADPNAWWQDETGQKEGILLFADLNSMELWDYEIAGHAVAKNYLFILYREPGGEWYVANWGYT